MNAKAQALTPAAVNRALDKINRNPALSEEDATFVREAKARIKELDALVLAAIDKRQWTTADKLDSQRSKLWKAIDVREGRKPRSANPASKTRAVRVVAANPLVKEAKSNKKANFPYCVQTQNTENWNTSACFKMKTEAVEYARALSEKYPRLPIRVMHFAGGPM